MRKTLAAIATFGLITIALLVGPAATRTGAADHLDAPTAKLDGRVDINDVYVFHPGAMGDQDLDRTVLVMTVNPGAGVLEHSSTTFSPDALYEFLIDTNGDAKKDISIRAQFSDVEDGEQDVKVRLIARGRRVVIAKGPTEEIVEGDHGMKVFAGLRDDPFFFDLANFNNGATFCGAGLPVADFFLGLNTTAIVVEVPTELIGTGQVGVWGRTLGERDDDAFEQIDRMGRPAILTVFVPPNPFEPGDTDIGNKEDLFNFGNPHRDQPRWRGEVVNSLTLLYSLNDSSGDDASDDAAKIQGLADVLLPDILTVDLSKETGFLNGRNLADDVIDAELPLITEGLITTDCVDNDSTFLADFPYVGEPNP